MKKVAIIFVSILFGINFTNAQHDCGCFDTYSRKADIDRQKWEAEHANDRPLQPFKPNFFDKYNSEYMQCLRQCEAEQERKREIERKKQRQEFERMKLKMQQEQAQQEVQRKNRQKELKAQMDQHNRDVRNAKIRARNEEIIRSNKKIAEHNARVRKEAAERRKQEAEKRLQARLAQRKKDVAPTVSRIGNTTGSAKGFITMQRERADEVYDSKELEQRAEKNKGKIRVTVPSISSDLRDFKYPQTTIDIPVSPMSLSFTESRLPLPTSKDEQEKIKEEARKFTGIYYIIDDNDGHQYFVLYEEDVYAIIENIEYDEESTSLTIPDKPTITIDGLDASRGVTEAYNALNSMENTSSYRLVENGKKCTFEVKVVSIYDPLAENSNTDSPISQITPQTTQSASYPEEKPIRKPKEVVDENGNLPGSTDKSKQK
jgi:hypothetical protein